MTGAFYPSDGEPRFYGSVFIRSAIKYHYLTGRPFREHRVIPCILRAQVDLESPGVVRAYDLAGRAVFIAMLLADEIVTFVRRCRQGGP